MMAELASLVVLSQAWLWAAFVVFLRVAALVFLAPGFGEAYVPARVKLGVTFAFMLIVLPTVGASIPPADTDPVTLLVLLAPEVLTGLFFGLGLRMFVFALQIAGSMAAQSTSLAQLFGGSAGADAQAAIGHVLVVAGLALAAVLGLHVLFASYILQSYAMVPVGALIDAQTVTQLGVAEVSAAFALGFQLAAPFLIASLIYNVTLGVINRAMPQLMVSFVGAPAITAGALLLLMLSAPMLLSLWHEGLAGFTVAPFGGLR